MRRAACESTLLFLPVGIDDDEERLAAVDRVVVLSEEERAAIRKLRKIRKT